MIKTESQKQKIERLAASHGLTSAEYKRRCDENTAKNKGLTPAEYSKKRIEEAAAKKNMTYQEYKKECYEKSARNKGFKTYKDYDKINKKAKRLGIVKEQYYNTLCKDKDDFYIV